FSEELRGFFEYIGIPTCAEDDGRVLPEKGNAGDAAQALVKWCVSRGVEIKTGVSALEPVIENSSVTGIKCSGGSVISCDAVILAAGGASYPKTGSDGSGFAFAHKAGHTIVEPRSALVPIESDSKAVTDLQGISLSGVGIVYIEGRKKVRERTGDMIFTHFGISGPAVLDLSGQAAAAFDKGIEILFEIDTQPDMNEGDLDRRLQELFSVHGKQKAGTVLTEFVPKRMAQMIYRKAGLEENEKAGHVKVKSRRKIVELLKHYPVPVSGYKPIEEAMVTAGGVSTKEIYPRTMESKIVKGLYFAGEVMDIQGESGGFNLQAAFSTGYTAGRAAGRAVISDQ
ncbi:NAD(P)/FAD-dependent oxidoreductase, partial [Planctomycetota bacterium]